jgi:hypothetical protein
MNINLNTNPNSLFGIDTSIQKQRNAVQGSDADALSGVFEKTSKEIAGRQNKVAPTDPAAQLAAHQAAAASGQTYYQAQALGQNDEGTKNMLMVGGNPTEELEDSNSAIAEFLEFMKMSPAERMRAQILKEENLTEEEYAALPPEKKAAIDQKIRERVEAFLKKQTDPSSSEA